MLNYSTLSNNPRGQRGHILIVEKDPGTGHSACKALRDNRFQTTLFNRRIKSSRSFSEYDLVLLEHHVHSQDRCLKTLQKLREITTVPIVVLADEPNSVNRIAALESGADDVLSRPYLGRELVARVRAILRRSRMDPHVVDRIKVLEIQREAKQVRVRGREVDLTQREFELLSVLASEPGRNFSRNEIVHSVWGKEYAGDQRRVDLYVSRIRAKMHEPNQQDIIRSIYGVGYRLEA